MKLCVIIPAYNEEETIGRVIAGIKKKVPRAQIIVVDDGSVDGTYEKAQIKNVIVCRHLINRGLGASLGTGIMCALDR